MLSEGQNCFCERLRGDRERFTGWGWGWGGGASVRGKGHQSCACLVLFEAGVAFALSPLASTPPTHDIHTAAGGEQASTQTDMPNPRENKKSCLQLDRAFSTSRLHLAQTNSWERGGGRRTRKSQRMAEGRRRYRKNQDTRAYTRGDLTCYCKTSGERSGM